MISFRFVRRRRRQSIACCVVRSPLPPTIDRTFDEPRRAPLLFPRKLPLVAGDTAHDTAGALRVLPIRVRRAGLPRHLFRPSMGKLKKYDCHKQKYYIPQNKPSWSLLNLKQASKKIDKEKSAAKKQALGKKKKIAQKLANRKGGRGERNPANPDHKKFLEKVRAAAQLATPSRADFIISSSARRRISFLNLRRADATRLARRTHADRSSTAASLARPGQEPQESQALRQDQRTQKLSLTNGTYNAHRRRHAELTTERSSCRAPTRSPRRRARSAPPRPTRNPIAL